MLFVTISRKFILNLQPNIFKKGKKTLYLTEETFTSVLGELPHGKFPLVKLARGEFPPGMFPRDKLPCGKLPRIY